MRTIALATALFALTINPVLAQQSGSHLPGGAGPGIGAEPPRDDNSTLLLAIGGVLITTGVIAYLVYASDSSAGLMPVDELDGQWTPTLHYDSDADSLTTGMRFTIRY